MQEEQRSFRSDDAGDVFRPAFGDDAGDAEENEEGRCILAADASEVRTETEAEYRMGSGISTAGKGSDVASPFGRRAGAL